MVDLNGQYEAIKGELDIAIDSVMSTTSFINGPAVKEFQNNLQEYLNVKHVIPCANGTDALQIALMSCNLKPGDEVICPSFTYVATAEVVALLGLKPVMANVDENTFNMRVDHIEPLITTRTKAIVPVFFFIPSLKVYVAPRAWALSSMIFNLFCFAIFTIFSISAG